MDNIRNHFLSKICAFVAGLAFLNMSFFLAEVSLLKFEKQSMMENIAKLILNAGFEEERDTNPSGETSLKITLHEQQVQIHCASSFLISTKVNDILIENYKHADHSLLFYPPPDSSFRS